MKPASAQLRFNSSYVDFRVLIALGLQLSLDLFSLVFRLRRDNIQNSGDLFDAQEFCFDRNAVINGCSVCPAVLARFDRLSSDGNERDVVVLWCSFSKRIDCVFEIFDKREQGIGVMLADGCE